MSENWTEIPVLIHGVDPSTNPKEHSRSYNNIISLINQQLKKQNKKQFTEKPISVEWGWDSGKSNQSDKYLSKAQLILYEKIKNSENKTNSFFFINLLKKFYSKLRKELLLGGGDIFYYLSQDGETAVRNNIFNYISKEIKKRKHKKISLTFLTHSAGTVVMHDFLYHLFGRKNNSPISSVNEIRGLVKNNGLRVRKIFTFGSPLTSVSLRSNTLLLNIVNKKKLNPESIGLLKSNNLTNPRWINFWDKDDVISFPLEFLYEKINNEQIVKDELINLKGFLFWKVHLEYWKSDKMARKIADAL